MYIVLASAAPLGNQDTIMNAFSLQFVGIAFSRVKMKTHNSLA